ncbi:MAG: hypothetical protein ABFS34_15770 [Gemmatimonadota bacterium]
MTSDRRRHPRPDDAAAGERRRVTRARARKRRGSAARYAALAAGIIFLAAVLDGLYAGDELSRIANPARVAAARSCHVESGEVVQRELGEDWTLPPYHDARVKDLGAGRFRVEFRATGPDPRKPTRVLCSAFQLNPEGGAMVAIDVRLRPAL